MRSSLSPLILCLKEIKTLWICPIWSSFKDAAQHGGMRLLGMEYCALALSAVPLLCGAPLPGACSYVVLQGELHLANSGRSLPLTASGKLWPNFVHYCIWLKSHWQESNCIWQKSHCIWQSLVSGWSLPLKAQFRSCSRHPGWIFQSLKKRKLVITIRHRPIIGLFLDGHKGVTVHDNFNTLLWSVHTASLHNDGHKWWLLYWHIQCSNTDVLCLVLILIIPHYSKYLGWLANKS